MQCKCTPALIAMSKEYLIGESESARTRESSLGITLQLGKATAATGRDHFSV